MGILSSTVSLTQYRVDGLLPNPANENLEKGLNANILREIDGESADTSVGWTSQKKPFEPDFSGSSFAVGPYFIFSLRIDKKSVPAKMLKKHVEMETARKLAESGREYLSKSEKKMLRENVLQMLCVKIPSTPNVYDIIWHHEERFLWFSTNLKSANEELETLFNRSFGLNLMRIIPYTAAFFDETIEAGAKDNLNQLSPFELMV